MAYHAFRIVQAPKRVSIKIPSVALGTPEPLLINKAYPMAVESEIKVEPYIGVPGEPLDEFIYQIQATPSSVWSKDIRFTINVSPEAGTPTCVEALGTELSIPSGTTQDVVEGFLFPNTTDRFKIDSITGTNGLMINDQPVLFGATYMRYDITKINFASTIPQEGSTENHAVINYRIGNKTTWAAAACSLTLKRFDKAYIFSTVEDVVQEKSRFKKYFEIEGGIPGTVVQVRITPSSTIYNFTVSQTNDLGIETITSLPSAPFVYDVNINDFGKGRGELSGVGEIDDFLLPFYFTINVEIISSNGSTTLVSSIKNNMTFEIFNLDGYDLRYLISGVSMNSTLFSNKMDYVELTVGTGTEVDMTIEVQTTEAGTLPYTYLVTSKTALTSVITQDGIDAKKWTINDMNGSAGAGNLHRFNVRVTDTQGIAVNKEFSILIKSETIAAVPVVSAPATITADKNAAIDIAIVASNIPTSYGATNLPAGLSLVGNRIQGSVATAGTYNATLTATNGIGVSSNFSCTITIVDVIGSLPELDSLTEVDLAGASLNYLIEYNGTPPVQVSVTNLPVGWYYNSSTKRVYGNSFRGAKTFNISLSNAYGTRNYLITVYGDAV